LSPGYERIVVDCYETAFGRGVLQENIRAVKKTQTPDADPHAPSNKNMFRASDVQVLEHGTCSDYHRTVIFIYIYTGCNRRNVRDFGRVFLMLNYTDITQNTYIKS